jgi:hypothetical protein
MEICLKPYFSWDTESCYIDSLFVSLFHSKNTLIKKFVDKLEINMYETLEDKIKIQSIGASLLGDIKNIYNKISTFHEKDQQDKCIDVRNLLKEHYLLIKKNNMIIDNDEFISFTIKQNNPLELLKYLYKYVFDIKSFNDMTIYSGGLDNYSKNDYSNFLNYYNYNIETPKYKQINFISLSHTVLINEYLNNYNFKDKININNTSNLFLYSIIADIGGHYICYYKCNSNWYLYDDLGIPRGTNNYTTSIGTLGQVMENYSKIIERRKENTILPIGRKLELILLYLKGDTDETSQLQQQKELKIQNIIEKIQEFNIERDLIIQQIQNKYADKIQTIQNERDTEIKQITQEYKSIIDGLSREI